VRNAIVPVPPEPSGSSRALFPAGCRVPFFLWVGGRCLVGLPLEDEADQSLYLTELLQRGNVMTRECWGENEKGKRHKQTFATAAENTLAQTTCAAPGGDHVGMRLPCLRLRRHSHLTLADRRGKVWRGQRVSWLDGH